jgi:hypothetical protein
MTNEQIVNLAKQAWTDAGFVLTDDDHAYVLPFARALLAAGASEGQAEPIYQARTMGSRFADTWTDQSKDGFDHMAKYPACFETRTVYLHPSAEIAALRKERDHWKANHDAQVSRARLLIERTDLPLDRVRAYEEVAALRERIAGMEKDAERMSALCDELDLNRRNVRYDGMPIWDAMCDAIGADLDGNAFRRAIDAAIAKEKQGK